MPSLMIADDEAVDRESARRCLREIEGLEIRFARDGAEAWALISASPPDLVLTDLRMPGIDGLELVKKAREGFPLVPVILMTSQGSEKVAVEALRAGAASYVPKSDLAASLADTVEHVLEVSRARRSRRAVLGSLARSETEFVLESDPDLVMPVVGFLQESLERLGFGDEALRTQIGIALSEAISNGMIHGNLEVGSDLRRESWDEYQKAIEARRREPPYAGRRLRCLARESPERVEYVVRDEGPGFSPGALPDPTDAENVLNVSGRGIFLIRTFMDSVAYDAKGREITMAKAARR